MAKRKNIHVGDVIAWAYDDLPGLAIGSNPAWLSTQKITDYCPPRYSRWALFHVASGAIMAVASTQKRLVEIARELLPIADWTLNVGDFPWDTVLLPAKRICQSMENAC